jgi:phytol kinase
LIFLAAPTPITIDIGKDLMFTGCALLYVLAWVLIPEILQKKGVISKFVARKLVHLFAGLAIIIAPFLTIPWFAVALAALMTLVTLKSSKHSSMAAFKGLYDAIGEEAEESKGYLQGPFHYALAITVLITGFAVIYQITAYSLFYLPIAGILIMIISDTLASIIGKRWGKHEIKVPWIKTRRTVEGSLAFLASAWVLCFIAFIVFGTILPGHSIVLRVPDAIILSVVTAVAGTLVELVSPSVWDDITVPIATTAIVTILAFALQLIVIV